MISKTWIFIIIVNLLPCIILLLCRAFNKKTMRQIQQGDFYYYDSSLIKVESFIGNTINPVVDKEDIMGLINLKDLKEIMLTPILLKNIGFEKTDNSKYILCSGKYTVEANYNKVKEGFDVTIMIPTQEEKLTVFVQEVNCLKRLLEAFEIRAFWDALTSL